MLKSPTYFTFIAVLGTSPAVITETLWYFAQQNTLPQEIHILTTATGQQSFQNRLPKQTWQQFCQDAFQGFTPTITFHLPQRHGLADADIRTADEDQRFGELVYEIVKMVSQKPMRCIGSLAGGRKTMSAHLLNAFALFAKPQDKLVHVLINPPSLEMNRDFLYPTPQYPDAQIQVVPVQFPRLSLLMPKIMDYKITDLFQQFPTAIPENFSLHATPKPKLKGLIHNETVAELKLTPSYYAFCCVLQKFPKLSNQMPFEDLNYIRQKAYDELGEIKDLGLWSEAQDITKAVSKLNKHLAKHLSFKNLRIESHKSSQETVYQWSIPPNIIT